jgi:hypothetical protein
MTADQPSASVVWCHSLGSLIATRDLGKLGGTEMGDSETAKTAKIAKIAKQLNS